MACAECGAFLLWAISPKQQWRPFDSTPIVVTPEGIPTYSIFDYDGAPHFESTKPHSLFGRRWTMHFDTCPARKELTT